MKNVMTGERHCIVVETSACLLTLLLSESVMVFAPDESQRLHVCRLILTNWADYGKGPASATAKNPLVSLCILSCKLLLHSRSRSVSIRQAVMFEGSAEFPSNLPH